MQLRRTVVPPTCDCACDWIELKNSLREIVGSLCDMRVLLHRQGREEGAVLGETMEATDYKILEKVGEGAFGTVFRALDRATGQQVALKKIRVRDVRILPPNALRELNAMRCLDHPHVMPLLGMHTHGANLVLVMPFVPCNLASLLAERDAPLPEAHAACLSRMLLEGLHAIHHHGLLHRDLKPGNLLLDASGRLLIADFGQARLRPREHDTASLSHAVATRWYRAPELLFGARRYDIGVDIWACGCVIAQLLTLSTCATSPPHSSPSRLLCSACRQPR